MEVTEEMINAVRAHVPAPCSKEKATLAVLGVLAIVERNYVPRWSSITERVPRQFLDTPWMEGFRGQIVMHAEYMGAEVVDLDHPEILPDDSPYTFGDYVALKWKIRRIA